MAISIRISDWTFLTASLDRFIQNNFYDYVYKYTVNIQKLERLVLEWSFSGHFLGPVFESFENRT
jgi:hypothetical protein